MGLFNGNKKDEYDKIIQEVKNNLTDNKEQNIKYLKEMCEKYKTHNMSTELIKEFGRMIFMNFADEEKEELGNMIDNEILIHFDKAHKLIEKGKIKEAKKELLEFIKIETIYKDDRVNTVYTPRNVIENVLCKEYDEKAKDVGIDFSSGFLELGCIEVEEQNFDKAQEYFKKSIRYNPYNATARFEEIDIYKRKKQLNELKALLDKTYKFIYLPQDLARYYRDLGYYYIEKGNYKMAKSLYIYSNIFDDSKQQIILNELNYIISITRDKKNPDILEAHKIIIEEGIEEFFYKDNVGIVLSLAKQVEEQKYLDLPEGEFISELAKIYLSFLKD